MGGKRVGGGGGDPPAALIVGEIKSLSSEPFLVILKNLSPIIDSFC